MRSRIPFRLLASLVYLGVVFVCAGYIYQRIQRFEGEICIEKGKVENVVVRPSGEGGGFASMQRNLALDVISFQDPEAARRHFDADKTYDVAELPFRLRLDDVVVLEERPPRDVLEVSFPGTKREYPAQEGASVGLDGDTGTIAGLRRWSGLVRNPKGQPMAVISLRRPDEPWKERLFLNAGAWRSVDSSMAVYFGWFENEQQANDGLPSTLPGIESARWGVVEGPSTQWVNAFTPGTGVTLSNGTEVILLRYEEAHQEEGGASGQSSASPNAGPRPAILLEIKRGEMREEGWVYANGASRDGTIRFEYPTRTETVLFVHAWRDGGAVFSVFHQGRYCGQKLLQENVVWAPMEGFACQIRLDQVMASALPVDENTGPVWELVIHVPSGDLHLREGESIRYRDGHLAYRRLQAAPKVRYHMSILPDDKGQAKTVMLSPGSSLRYGDWRFSQASDNPDAASIAVLHAERTLGGYTKAVGALLFIVGSFGLVIVRFWKQ